MRSAYRRLSFETRLDVILTVCIAVVIAIAELYSLAGLR